MDAYDHLYSADDINMIIDTINEMYSKTHPNMFAVCHGRYHTMFVVDKVEYILKSLSYDLRTVELGKIAALLHDIGNIAGRWNHERKSAVLAKVFFDGSSHLSDDEKDTVIQAIDDHAGGNNISSVVGAALLIADRIDVSKQRLLPVEIINPRNIISLEIENVDISIFNENIVINFITTDNFSKESFIHEYDIDGYKKSYNIIMKAVKYLNCTCHIQFNGVEDRFE